MSIDKGKTTCACGRIKHPDCAECLRCAKMRVERYSWKDPIRQAFEFIVARCAGTVK